MSLPRVPRQNCYRHLPFRILTKRLLDRVVSQAHTVENWLKAALLHGRDFYPLQPLAVRKQFLEILHYLVECVKLFGFDRVNFDFASIRKFNFIAEILIYQ